MKSSSDSAKFNFGDKVVWKTKKGEEIRGIFMYENAAGCFIEGENVSGYVNPKDLTLGWEET